MKKLNFHVISALATGIIFLTYLNLSAQDSDNQENIISEKNTETPVSETENLKDQEPSRIDKEIVKINQENNEKKNVDKAAIITGNRFPIIISAGIDVMRGKTTYQIGGFVETATDSGYVRFPVSELIFPLNTFLLFLETNIRYPNIPYFKKFKANLIFKTNLKKQTDNMEDRDWGVPYEYPANSGNYYLLYGEDHLDIYSESNTEMKTYIVDTDIMYRIFRIINNRKSEFRINFFLGLGYLYQHNSFGCRLIQQWDYRYDMPPGVVRANVTGNGKLGLTYDVFSHIPYIKINTEVILHKRNLTELSIGYSPYAMLMDRDAHIARAKVSESKCNGDAFLISLSSRFDILDSLFIKVHADYFKMETKGRENQYLYYSDEWYEIDHKAFSTRYSFGLSAGYKLK
jgi:hypothetical protein